MGSIPQICYTLLIATTLVACSSDTGTSADSSVGEESQPSLLSDVNAGDSGSVINRTNYMSLLRGGLDTARNRLSGEFLFLDAAQFTTATGSDTGIASNQPCIAGGTYNLFTVQSDDPGSLELGFLNTPIKNYSFTGCTGSSNTAISGSYEFSEFLATELSEFTASTEEIDLTFFDVETPEGLENITLNGTIGRSFDGGSFFSSFDIESYAVTDATGGTLQAVGTGSLEVGEVGVVYELDMVISGSRLAPENPDVPITLRTEEFEVGSNPSLIVVDDSLVATGVVVLSAPDGSSVRAEASSNQTIADITLSTGTTTTMDSRPWTDFVP